ncbi:hypothetical protein ABEB36_008914 [Hypothenemus hampei]|uniref:Uncharacterized protein n=1 Tax=Hypothenemus hampei TaxID=57062 RepID=A0ABD1EP19_HYPHA
MESQDAEKEQQSIPFVCQKEGFHFLFIYDPVIISRNPCHAHGNTIPNPKTDSFWNVGEQEIALKRIGRKSDI